MTTHAASRTAGTDTQLSEEERAIVGVVRDFVDQRSVPGRASSNTPTPIPRRSSTR